MSAWGIGATAATRRGNGVRRAGADPATVEPGVPSVDTLVTWIPGEVIAAYAAIVLALQPLAEGDEEAAIEITWGGWVVAGMITAGLLTWLGGWSKATNFDGRVSLELAARVVFAALAFGLWSVIVPGSWWYSVGWVAENKAIVPIGVGVLAAAFALFAEGVVRRIGGG